MADACIKQDIEIVRGMTNTFDITLTDASGDPYELGANEKLIFGVKSDTNNDEYSISKTLTSSNYTDGKYRFTLSPSETEGLAFGTYFYDIGLQKGADFYPVVRLSRFVILQSVTRRVVT